MELTAIINVSNSCQNYFPNSFKYKHIPVNDDGEADLLSWFDEAAEFIGKFHHLHFGINLQRKYLNFSSGITVAYSCLPKSKNRHPRTVHLLLILMKEANFDALI